MTSDEESTVSVTYTARLGRRLRSLSPLPQGSDDDAVSPLARRLALAHWIERRIAAGDLRDLAHAAEVIGVTRARMTQIADLALLPPNVQEDILLGRLRTTERELRLRYSRLLW